LTASTPKEAQEVGLSIIHQELNLVPHLSVAENIWLGREPVSGGLFTRPGEQVRRTRELLERLGMKIDAKASVSSLSVAQQQMVEIAKALSFDSTKVLIMDEPTAALNDAEVAQLHDMIRRFVTPSTGVVYISHKMGELKRIADRITVIRDGHYIDTMNMADVTIDEVIAKMVGRAINTAAKPENVRDDRPIVLQVSGLSTKSLLKDITFELHRGEVLGFAGLMGAGRTEVARAIVGADPITAGELIINGNPVTVKSPAQAAAHGIGYLSEDRKGLGLLLGQPVSFNIAISSLGTQFSQWGFVKDRAMRESAEASRKLLNIKTPSVAQLVKYLSGGNQQKAIIARWLVKDCEVLIFDEPTRGIDVGAKEEIYQLLNKLAEQGKSIIMISSELPEILRMSHRVVVMADGMVKGVLPAKDADQESIMRLATHSDEVVTHPTEKAGQ
jgi:ribose transport system ATP-binding protein